MKALTLSLLILASSAAQSAVLCQSVRDPNFKAWFEGYSCPSGYFMIASK